MAQHFLLTKGARDFTVRDVEKMSDAEVHDTFARIRWGCSGTQTCPSCGVMANHYFLRTRKQWRYVTEIAWREDVRRVNTRAQVEQILGANLKSGRSESWRGYCQGHHREGEMPLIWNGKSGLARVICLPVQVDPSRLTI